VGKVLVKTSIVRRPESESSSASGNSSPLSSVQLYENYPALAAFRGMKGAKLLHWPEVAHLEKAVR
jgi:hypothetical protein